MPKKSKAKPKELNEKQKMFCKEYIVDFNGTQAAIRAGYSKRTAAVQSSEHLRKPNIRVELAKLIKERSDKVGFDAKELLKHLVDDVRADISDLFDDEGRLRQPHEWPLPFRQGLVGGIDVTQLFEYDTHGNKEQVGIVTKIKLADRTKLKELAGKHVDIAAFKERVEHSVDETLEDILSMANGNGHPK